MSDQGTADCMYHGCQMLADVVDTHLGVDTYSPPIRVNHNHVKIPSKQKGNIFNRVQMYREEYKLWRFWVQCSLLSNIGVDLINSERMQKK